MAKNRLQTMMFEGKACLHLLFLFAHGRIAPGGAAQEDDRDPFDGQLDAPPAQPAESAATADESDAATP